MRSMARAAMLLTLATGCATRRPAPVAMPVAPVPAAQLPILLIPRALPPETIEAKSAPCLGAADLRRLRAARPRPLRSQRMPPTPAERVARTSAQLGLYEATGAWADQVEDALAKCD